MTGRMILSAPMKRRFFSPKMDTRRQRAQTREGMVVTTVALERDQHARLKAAAKRHSTVLTAVVRQAVEEWLDRDEKPTSPKEKQR
jgi:hypothetical protein